MSNVDFILDKSGGADILRNNPGIAQIQMQNMNRILDTVRAQFVVEFGFEGNFDLMTEPTAFRQRVMIKAADKRTAGVLNTKPGWLGSFVKNLSI